MTKKLEHLQDLIEKLSSNGNKENIKIRLKTEVLVLLKELSNGKEVNEAKG